MTPATSTLMTADQLMSALPIGAAITVAARSLFGIRTVGVFAPALFALTLLQMGLFSGGLTMLAGAAAGAITLPLVEPLALPRVARLALVVCAICATVRLLGSATEQGGALPIVALAAVVERSGEVFAVDGWRAGTRCIVVTSLLGVAVAATLSLPGLSGLLAQGGLAPIAVGAVAIIAAGSYRGLRLGERRRFRTLLQLGQG